MNGYTCVDAAKAGANIRRWMHLYVLQVCACVWLLALFLLRTALWLKATFVHKLFMDFAVGFSTILYICASVHCVLWGLAMNTLEEIELPQASPVWSNQDNLKRHGYISPSRNSYSWMWTICTYLKVATQLQVGQPITKLLSGFVLPSHTSSMQLAVHISQARTWAFTLKWVGDLQTSKTVCYITVFCDKCDKCSYLSTGFRVSRHSTRNCLGSH